MTRAIAIILLLAGCATERGGLWERAGSTRADFDREHYACTRDTLAIGAAAHLNLPSHIATYKLCMKAAGWTFGEA